MLHLVLAARYPGRLVANPDVAAYVEKRHPDILTEFRSIVATSPD